MLVHLDQVLIMTALGHRAEPHDHSKSTEIGKPRTSVFMVIMASSIARGHVPPSVRPSVYLSCTSKID